MVTSCCTTTDSPTVSGIRWPRKYDILGVGVSATTYENAQAVVMQAARTAQPALVTHLAVHGLVLASRDPRLRSALEHFQIVAPDGMPVRIAMDVIHRTRLPDRVYGPELMRRLCAAAAQEGVGVYLYGSHLHVARRLKENLLSEYPGLRIVGSRPSAFRPLTLQEDAELVGDVNASGAGIVFLGLGCPLQERFAFEHSTSIRAVQVCVGAAFDFHSGNKAMAPPWMQRASLEWLFRLGQEPRRLWRRYLVLNTVFAYALSLQLIRSRRRRRTPDQGQE